MKNLILWAVLALVLLASQAFAAGQLCLDSNGSPIQGFCPNGLESAALTVVGLTKDNSKYPTFSIYSPIDCKIRLMATSAKAGSVSETIVGGAWQTFVVHPATPFMNASGCTGGNFRR